MLHQEIKTSVRAAMREKNPIKLGVIRGLIAACTNELVAKKRKPDETLSDEETLAVIRREAKRREEAIAQFSGAGRTDLAEAEQQELALLKNYLPTELPEAELRQIISQKINELNIGDKSATGKLIGAVMKETAGRASGDVVKKIVSEFLNN